jgi:uncharacterized repeat protein (TIGR01451 family)
VSLNCRQFVRPAFRFSSWHGLMLTLSAVCLTGCAMREARMSMQKIGPQRSIVGQPTEFTITLNNVGDGSATDVVVQDTLPAGMTYVASSPTGRYESNERAVYWDLGTLEPGAGTTLGVTVKGDRKGERCNLARVEAAGGVSGTARSCTVLAGLAELDVVVRASPDPVGVGFSTTYTIEVKNHGSETATNIRVKASIPRGLVYLTSSGPTASRSSGNEVSFVPLPALPPNASLPYRLLARAQTPGAGRFEAQITADHLSTPITAEKLTRVTGSSAGRQPSRRTGLTQMEAKDQIERVVSVENVLVRGRAVTGRIVNRSSRRLRNVYLMIRSIWLWDDEFHPREQDPSSSTRYRVPGEVPAEGFLPFVYRPLPLPPRLDGHYETSVSIAEFSEVP